MATTIITKNGSGAPVAGDLVQGELAVDLTNKEVYTKDSNGAVVKVGSASDDSGIPEAPEDGKSYTRKDAGWSEANYAAVDASYTKSESDSKYAAVGSGGSVDSVNGQTGVVTLTYTDVGAAPTGDYATNADVAAYAYSKVETEASVKSKRFVETVREPRYQGGAATLELDLANNFTMDFSASTSYVLGLSGAPSAAGDAYGFTLTLDTTLMDALVWDDTIKWSTGTAPTLTAGVTYVFTFLTTDGGSTFKGFLGGEAFA